jgi:hypothetical protein
MQGPPDHALGRSRGGFGTKVHEYRSLGTRFEKLAVNYVAMWWIAIIEKALKRLFPDRPYALSNAGPEVSLEELVRVRFTRHRIEEVFEAAKQETGLAHYEVRGRVGWHHHVTLSLLALWFLCGERRRVGGKTRAVTVSQVREVFTRQLRAPSPERIAAEVPRVLYRTESARIYHWHQATGGFPPRRRPPDTS